jgi:polar amino acid transport system ATP-binding protein
MLAAVVSLPDLPGTHIMPMIAVDNVHKSYGDAPALRGVSFAVEASELTVIIGPSGCGKSTLLRCINGLETMDSGRISVGNTTLAMESGRAGADHAAKLHTIRQSVGMVFQSFNLFPHLTAVQNVMKAPMVVQGKSRDEAREIAEKQLTKVGLAARLNHYPHQLSGGQQQRCAIARALAMNPAVMLYDEPTSALDPSLVNEVLAIMKQLDDEGLTQIVVTHEMRFARQAADKVVMLHEGKLAECGTAGTVFTSPSSAEMRAFLAHFEGGLGKTG